MDGTMGRGERWAWGTILLAAAVAGIGLRAWHIFAEPLWLDEAYSAYAAGKDFGFLWHIVPRYETHPPFYYTLLHLWEQPYGGGLAALRSLGLIAGLATPPAMAWAAAAIGVRLGWDARRRAWLVCTVFALACLSFPLVEMTREVRPYPLMILIYALAIRAMLGVAARGVRSSAYAAYLIGLALLLWLHNLGPLWGVALGLALLVAVVRPGMAARDWIGLIGGHAIVALIYLPALLILLDQAPTWVSATWLQFSFTNLWPRVATLYGVPGWQGLSNGLLALLGAVALWRAADRRLLAMLLLLALLPVALSITLSATIAPVFITRTMTPAAVPTLLAFGIGTVVWRGRLAILAIGAAAMLAANLLAVDVQARANGPMQDWYRAIGWLRRHYHPGDRILAYPNEAALPMERALRDQGLDWPVDPIPEAVPALGQIGTHPTGSRGVLSLSPARLHAIAQSPTVRAIPTIWLLRLGEKTYDPGDVALHEFAAGRRFAGSYTDSAIKLAGFARWRRAPDRNRR